ncbi:hypothetical protein FOA52_008616 [Chlamydomonas sp. UWO 241]|nr:hypothetical protein FOA52_008616 [Chlamydomonas sp. UWO 241]
MEEAHTANTSPHLSGEGPIGKRHRRGTGAAPAELPAGEGPSGTGAAPVQGVQYTRTEADELSDAGTAGSKAIYYPGYKELVRQILIRGVPADRIPMNRAPEGRKTDGLLRAPSGNPTTLIGVADDHAKPIGAFGLGSPHTQTPTQKHTIPHF